MAIDYPDMMRGDILALVPADGKVIGSVGCGTGRTEWELVKQGRTVMGVDINAEAVAIAAARLSSARTVAPDDRQPFAPESLDGLILADVIEHMPQAWEALAAYSRCVKPGGWVVISVPNMRHYSVFWHLGLRGDWPEHPCGIFDRTHVQVMTRRRLVRWCEGAGLRVESWFWQYGTRTRMRWYAQRLLDACTIGLLRDKMLFQLEVRCRRN